MTREIRRRAALRAPGVALLGAIAAAGCSRSPPSVDPPKAGEGAASAGVAPASTGAASGGRCGPLECTLYDAPEAAIAALLAPRPRLLAVGEAHAQKGEGRGASVAKRFAESLLPALEGKASDLLVELMLPPTGCPKSAEAVRERQAPALAPQAETNQGDYVALGEAARRRGVVPDALRPSCADLAAIDRAGDDAIGAMMATIARLTAAKAGELLARVERADPGKVVVTYGGALHNDLAPRPGREAWAFGPALERAAGGRYVELDLFAPEAIGESEVWRALPWHAHYDAARFGAKAVLFRTGPKSYALVLPREAPSHLYEGRVRGDGTTPPSSSFPRARRGAVCSKAGGAWVESHLNTRAKSRRIHGYFLRAVTNGNIVIYPLDSCAKGRLGPRKMASKRASFGQKTRRGGRFPAGTLTRCSFLTPEGGGAPILREGVGGAGRPARRWHRSKTNKRMAFRASG